MGSFVHRPQAVLVRRALFQVHLWAGIAAGIYIFVVCVSGAALVFRIEMQRASYPELFTPSAPGPLAEPMTIIEHVRSAYPDGQVSGIDAPTTLRPTYLAYVSRGSSFLTVLVDPVSARVLGELPDRTWVRTLQDLHFDLMGGRTGRLVNGAGAALLLLMCVTGLVIWWPGLAQWGRALTVDFGRSWKRINWDLHSALGFWTLAFTAMWAVTGINFAFPSTVRSTVNAVSPLTVTRPPSSGPVIGPSLSGAVQIERARTHAPGQFVARVVLPYDSKSAFLVLFSKQSPTPGGSAQLEAVYLDQYTGEALQEAPHGSRTAGDVVMAWLSPLHVGNFGGPVIRAAWLILGLAPALLFVTGFLMWWVRVVRPRRARHVSTTVVEA